MRWRAAVAAISAVLWIGALVCKPFVGVLNQFESIRLNHFIDLKSFRSATDQTPYDIKHRSGLMLFAGDAGSVVDANHEGWRINAAFRQYRDILHFTYKEIQGAHVNISFVGEEHQPSLRCFALAGISNPFLDVFHFLCKEPFIIPNKNFLDDEGDSKGRIASDVLCDNFKPDMRFEIIPGDRPCYPWSEGNPRALSRQESLFSSFGDTFGNIISLANGAPLHESDDALTESEERNDKSKRCISIAPKFIDPRLIFFLMLCGMWPVGLCLQYRHPNRRWPIILAGIGLIAAFLTSYGPWWSPLTCAIWGRY